MKHALLLFILIVLSSCSQQVRINSASPPFYKQDLSRQQQQELAKIPQNWDLSGRISIIHDQENWYAHFRWLKQTEQFQLRFTGPLGETHLLLKQELLQQTKRIKNTLSIGTEVYTNEGDIEVLLNNYSNMPIPINSLQYWIFGRYNPHQAYQVKMLAVDSPIDVIAELLQQDWTIQFSRYQQQEQEYKRQNTLHYPAKIIAKNKDYSIKVFVSSRNINN